MFQYPPSTVLCLRGLKHYVKLAVSWVQVSLSLSTTIHRCWMKSWRATAEKGGKDCCVGDVAKVRVAHSIGEK